MAVSRDARTPSEHATDARAGARPRAGARSLDPELVGLDLVDWIATRRTLALSRVRFDPAGYTSELIERGNGFELYLLAWLPGQATAIHDHGGAITASEVIYGRLQEERFAVRDGRLHDEERFAASRDDRLHGDRLASRDDELHGEFAMRDGRAALESDGVGPGVVDVHAPDVVHRVRAIIETVSLLVYLPGRGSIRTYEELP